jgi:HEAT repeat protein
MNRLISSGALFVLLLCPANGSAYIDSPAEGLTLPKLVLEFRTIRVLQVEKMDLERGAIVFKSIERIQGHPDSQTVKHSVKYDGAVPGELKNVRPGSKAIFFSGDGYKRGITLIDGAWYISNYNGNSGWWYIAGTAAHYDFNCVFIGSVAELTEAVKKLHRGDDVVVRCRKKSQVADTQVVSYNLGQLARKQVVSPAKLTELKPTASDKRSLAQLLDALKDPKVATRVEATEAIGQLGKAAYTATPALSKALADDKDPFVRRAAAVALGEIGPQAKAAVPNLLAALDSHYENVGGLVGSESAVALNRIDPDGKVLLPLLLPLLKDINIETRSKAATQLEIIGPAAKGAASLLIEVITKDKEGGVRYLAARALSSIGLDAKQAVPVFILALKDSHKFVRLTAARALGDFGPAAKEAVPALKAATKDADDEVKQSAMESLQMIGQQ